MIKKWMYRSAGQANASPALFAAGLVVCVAIATYVYRRIIIETLIDVAIGLGSLTAIFLIVALAVNYHRWDKRRTLAFIQKLADRDAPEDASPDADGRREAMAKDADALANDGVELFWGPDGTLRAKQQDD